MGQKEWIYIDDIEISDNTQCIHCDTRDFHILTTEDPVSVELLDFSLDTKKKQEAFDQCIFKDWEEIKAYLKGLEEVSGGKGEWRFLSFDYPYKGSHYLAHGWHKYFRFARLEEGWFAYTESGNNYYVIRKDFVNIETMIKDKQSLNFH